MTHIRKDKLRLNLRHFDDMRNVLEEASIVKIQTYLRKIVLPRRMELKIRGPTSKGKKKKKGNVRTNLKRAVI